MIASAARRRGIIRDQKQPLDFVVARYSSVYDGICECLLAGNDVTPIRERIAKLYDATPKTTWHAQDYQLSAEALESFLAFVDEIDLSRFALTRAGDSAPAMSVCGVEVSVRPDILLRAAGVAAPVGAVKIYVSKNFPFDEKSGAYAGVIVHQYVSDVLAANAKPEPGDSCVIDVFQRKIFVAPRAYKKKRTDVAAACEEIAQRWAAV